MSDSSPCPNCGIPLPAGRFRVECPHCLNSGEKGGPANGTDKPWRETPVPADNDSREFGAAVEDSLSGAVRVGDLPVPPPAPRKALTPADLERGQVSPVASNESGPPRSQSRSPKSPARRAPVLVPDAGSALKAPVSVFPRSGNRLVVALVLALLSIGSVALITALVAWLANRSGQLSVARTSAEELHPAGGESSADEAGDARRKIRTAGLNRGNGRNSDNVPTRTLAFKATPPRHYKATEIGECWRSVRQRMLLLEVSRPESTLRIPAVILDSRGWIATSYSAIAGSSSVVARMAPMTIHDYASARDLSATVTEVVASRPDLDLVLLQVDRRLVEVIGPTTIASRTPVAGTHLLAIGPLPTGFSPWVTETQVLSGDRAIPVGQPADTATEDWLIHDRPQSIQSPGTALFNLESQLVGITSAVSPGTTGQRAAKAEVLQAWLGEVAANEKENPARTLVGSLDSSRSIAPIEFNAIPDIVPPADATGVLNYPLAVGPLAPVAEVEGKQTPVPETTPRPTPPASEPEGVAAEPVGPLIDRISEVAALCTRFGFVPADAAQYDQLAELAGLLMRAQLLIEIPENDAGSLGRRDWIALDGAVSELVERILANVRQAGPVEWDRVNLLCLERRANAPTGPAMLIGMTLLSADVCPPVDGQPATLFAIERADAAVIVPTNPERRSYRQATRWLLVGDWLDQSPVEVATVEHGGVLARHFAARLAIGPVK
jgi:Trypsin-like peptidase domain